MYFSDTWSSTLIMEPGMNTETSGAEHLRENAARSFSEQLSRSPNAVTATDRVVPILLAMSSPRIILFERFLDDAECEAIIDMSKARLERSTVADPGRGGKRQVHVARTSSGMHFRRAENDLIGRIERRISELLSYPAEKGEPFQVLRYEPGQQYLAHQDYFDPSVKGYEEYLADGGQRVGTLVIYLNDVEAGGATSFPKIGLDVLPKRGNAVFFSYLTADGALDPSLLHAGSPVTKGEKWIAVKWFRQGECRPDQAGHQAQAPD